MGLAGRTLAAALVSAAATVTVALFSAYRLADAPVRGRLGGPDPVGSMASAAGLGTALRGYSVLLRDQHFVAIAVLPGLGMAVLMSYVLSAMTGQVPSPVCGPLPMRSGYVRTRFINSAFFPCRAR